MSFPKEFTTVKQLLAVAEKENVKMTQCKEPLLVMWKCVFTETHSVSSECDRDIIFIFEDENGYAIVFKHSEASSDGGSRVSEDDFKKILQNYK